MGGKIKFELGPTAIALIALAAIIGYVIGSTYPFGGKGLATESSSLDQGTPTLGSPQVNPTGYGQADIKKWASEIGLNANEFNSCFDSKKYLQEIQLEYAQGLDVGVSGTPAFLVGNDQAGFAIVTGAQTFDVFRSLIDSYLNGTAPPKQVTLTVDPIGNSSFIGNRDAEVMIIEFSDFQCPFCRSFYTNTLPQIESEYLDSGKAVLVYKEYPLTSIHPGAVDYGLAAKCGQEKGKWREMHDKIFDEQNKLGPATIPYSP
jgi:protein-disulfide isomerase